jgi:hypothetical protein
MTNFVVLDTQGKVWRIPPDVRDYHQLLAYVHHNRLKPEYYSHHAHRLLVNGEEVLLNVADIAEAYVKALNKAIEFATEIVKQEFTSPVKSDKK